MSTDHPLAYELHAVWPEPDTVTLSDALHFWENEGAIDSPEERRARATELLAVARGSRKQIVALATASRRLIPQLGFDCFYYRTFTSTKHRGLGLRASDVMTRLYCHAYWHLNARFQQGIDPQVLGVYFEIENPSLARHAKHLIWSQHGLSAIYIGPSERGLQQRVTYFENAPLPSHLLGTGR